VSVPFDERNLWQLIGRLEREEKERLEIARLQKLAEMKSQLEADRQKIKDAGGVVFKGMRIPAAYSCLITLSSSQRRSRSLV
jgi:hypothetical protein